MIVSTVTGTRGGTIAVPIRLVGATNIVGIQFDLIYPPTQILSGYPFTGLSTSGLKVISAEMTNGIRRIVVYTHTNQELGNGILVNVPLSIKTNTPNSVSWLFVSNVILARPDGTKHPLVFLGDGTLTIAPAASAQLGALVRMIDGGIGFQMAGTDGAAYTIQASTNLVDWVFVNTFLTSSGLIDFTDAGATNFSQRFFRAVGR